MHACMGLECGEQDGPLTTSLTQAKSAKMSMWYSGRLRGSMLASGVGVWLVMSGL